MCSRSNSRKGRKWIPSCGFGGGFGCVVGGNFFRGFVGLGVVFGLGKVACLVLVGWFCGGVWCHRWMDLGGFFGVVGVGARGGKGLGGGWVL